jgi:hypothetical protein
MLSHVNHLTHMYTEVNNMAMTLFPATHEWVMTMYTDALSEMRAAGLDTTRAESLKNEIVRIRTQFDNQPLQDYHGAKLEELKTKAREQIKDVKYRQIPEALDWYMNEAERLHTAHLSRNDVESLADAQIVLSRITEAHRQYAWELFTLYRSLDERGRTYIRNHYQNILEDENQRTGFAKLLNEFEETPEYSRAIKSVFSVLESWTDF